MYVCCVQDRCILICSTVLSVFWSVKWSDVCFESIRNHHDVQRVPVDFPCINPINGFLRQLCPVCRQKRRAWADGAHVTLTYHDVRRLRSRMKLSTSCMQLAGNDNVTTPDWCQTGVTLWREAFDMWNLLQVDLSMVPEYVRLDFRYDWTDLGIHYLER